MSSQSKLPFAAPASTPVEPIPLATRDARQSGSASTAAGELAPVWLQRLSLAVLVVFCLYLGGLLVYLPWWPEMWDHNSLLLGLPRLHHYLIQGPVRGVVSGIGLLDLWIGISEIVHYREYRA